MSEMEHSHDAGGERPPEPTPEERMRRREFLAVLGAGFTAVSAHPGGFRRPAERIIPHLLAPEDSVPGVAEWYASTCPGCPTACGVLVKCVDGRPIKIEGNPGHPLSRGGLCARGQASVLDLYDSQRLRGPRLKGREATWEQIDAFARGELDRVRREGGAVRLLSGTIHSPTRLAAIAAFLDAFPGARHVVYDPVSYASILDAHRLTHGERLLPWYRFERAKAIVAFDADFLGTWLSPVEFTKGWSPGRRPVPGKPEMSWHAQFEARLSLTGANADLRAALPPSAFLSALHDLHRRVARRLNREPGPAVAAAAPAPGLPAAALEEAARRLAEAAGRSLVVSGVRDVRVQTVVNRLNHLLGNYGKTLDLERPSLQYAGDDAAMDALIDDLEAGQVGALIVLDANPAHDHPRAAAFRRGLSKTSLMLSLSDRNDETASLAHAVCPDAHPLETWGDSHPHVGIYGIAQPVLAPLSATRPAVETLMMWAGHPDSAHAFQRRIWRERVFPRQTRHADFEAFWDAALRDGAAAVESESLPERAWVLREPPAPSDLPPPADGALEIDVHPGIALGDGRQANNPWLQELPDPLAKVAWGNVAALSPATAVRLGVTDGRVVELSGGNHTARLPVAIQPGMADNVVAVALGYGRPRAGDVAAHYPVERVLAIDKEPPGGADVYPFLRFGRVRVTPTGDMSLPARTQRYDVQTVPWTGQHRACARETTLAAFSQDPGAAHPPEPARGGSLWPAHPPEGPKWGMAIDLSVCTGCSACVIACQAENNIPVVGKAEVRKGREMHWLRIDRYYSGGPDRPDDAPDVVFQPMLCQQCDNAPCETVCPALATLHSRDGLNMQVYNRCVGTRYCANNCPYKVRRFNWFDYAHDDAVQNLALNPNVTVRSRGIMEKCSFCVQRIAEARMRARAEGRRPADGEIQPACMESCPADAIVFGDVTDLASRVTAASRDPRSYSVLGELGTAPAVRYLAKVRNREL